MARGLRSRGVVLISVSLKSSAAGVEPLTLAPTKGEAEATAGEIEGELDAVRGCVMVFVAPAATLVPAAAPAAAAGRGGSGFFRSDKSISLPVTSSRMASGLRSGTGAEARCVNAAPEAPGPALNPPPLTPPGAPVNPGPV